MVTGKIYLAFAQDHKYQKLSIFKLLFFQPSFENILFIKTKALLFFKCYLALTRKQNLKHNRHSIYCSKIANLINIHLDILPYFATLYLIYDQLTADISSAAVVQSLDHLNYHVSFYSVTFLWKKKYLERASYSSTSFLMGSIVYTQRDLIAFILHLQQSALFI